MWTRGLWGFYSDGVTKATYNHSDSYPDGLGTTILKFIAKNKSKPLKEIFGNIQMIKEDDEPTKEQIEECHEYCDLTVSSQTEKDWYCLLRDTQGNPKAYMDGLKYMINSQEFIENSLFCEYAYIINLDRNVLEFYDGFNKKIQCKKVNRYMTDKPNGDGYYPCKLVLEIPFKDISNKTVKKLINKMNELSEE